jgi:hypothetical protein
MTRSTAAVFALTVLLFAGSHAAQTPQPASVAQLLAFPSSGSNSTTA